MNDSVSPPTRRLAPLPFSPPLTLFFFFFFCGVSDSCCCHQHTELSRSLRSRQQGAAALTRGLLTKAVLLGKSHRITNRILRLYRNKKNYFSTGTVTSLIARLIITLFKLITGGAQTSTSDIELITGPAVMLLLQVNLLFCCDPARTWTSLSSTSSSFTLVRVVSSPCALQNNTMVYSSRCNDDWQGCGEMQHTRTQSKSPAFALMPFLIKPACLCKPWLFVIESALITRRGAPVH